MSRMTVDEFLTKIDELIEEAHKEPQWSAESALRCLKTEVMKCDLERMASGQQKRREWQKQYRESHREQAYQTTKEWRKKNPEKWKAQKARYRERIRKRKDGEAE